MASGSTRRRNPRKKKVSDGIRTHDRLDHNQELYQLSYAHRGKLNLPLPPPRGPAHPDDGSAAIGLGEDLINNIF